METVMLTLVFRADLHTSFQSRSTLHTIHTLVFRAVLTPDRRQKRSVFYFKVSCSRLPNKDIYIA